MARWKSRNKWMYLAICATVVLFALAPRANAQAFTLHDGDSVVFYGDSITAQRLYTKDVEEFLLTRYPKLRIHFVNAGVPGDTVKGGYAGTVAERIQRDVAPFHPAMITVMLGMNDGGWGFGPADIDATFQKGYRALLSALHEAAPTARFTLICPTPYDEITHGTEFPGYSRVIDKFGRDVAAIGAQMQAPGDKGVLVADFNRSMNEAVQRAKAQFPELAPLIIPDRIHPSETGHWIMAASLLSAWHVDPIVSSVTLNAAAPQVVDSRRTTVTNLLRSTSGLEWTQRDDALPLPLDLNNAMTMILLKIADLAQLDQLLLRVGSLDRGQYEFSIDGKAVAEFSADELEHGVNLALIKTPMLDEAREIGATQNQRAILDQARFILSADVKQSANSEVTEGTLGRVEDELLASIRANLSPKPHRLELRRHHGQVATTLIGAKN